MSSKRRACSLVVVDVTLIGVRWKKGAVELLSAAHSSGMTLRVFHEEDDQRINTAPVFVRPEDIMEEGSQLRLERQLRQQFNDEEAKMWRRERKR